jgi:restriction system protein
MDLLYPTLEALRDLGGSARIDEIVERVAEREGFSDEDMAVRRSPGHHMGLIEYRLAWARNYLKNIGAIENSSRGVWSLTPDGKTMSADEIPDRVRTWKTEYNRAYYEKKKATADVLFDEDEEEAEAEPVLDWKEMLLDRLLEMQPDAFERLAQRLLKEAGFRNVEVLGRSGDGGLDGVGVYRVSLVSFPVFFQCKRYRGSVRAGAVRDFRGAMAGRGEKGLLISTGSFTRDARDEATRDGAPPVELIDGDDLCELLREYEVGVVTRERVIQEIEIDGAFFDQF